MATGSGISAVQCSSETTVCLLNQSQGQVEVKIDDLLNIPGSRVNCHCVITGYSGQGKSTLAQKFLLNRKFEAVFIISGPELDEKQVWEVVKTQIPSRMKQTGFTGVKTAFSSPVEAAEWMENAEILLIIDDFLPRWIPEVTEALEEWRKMCVVLFTIPDNTVQCQEMLSKSRVTRVHCLAGLGQKEIFSIAAKYLANDQWSALTVWFIKNWWICRFLSYGRLIKPFCRAWQSGFIRDLTTETGLLWAVIDRIIADKNGLQIDKLERWWIVLGGLCRRSLETGYPLNVLEMEQEICNIFPSELKGVILDLLPISKSGCSQWLSLPQPLMEFLAAWDAIHHNLSGTAIKSLVKRIVDEDPVVIYMAGHWVRITRLGTPLTDRQLTRLCRNLILQMDRTSDRFNYTVRIISESGMNPELIQFMVKEVDFPKLWGIGDSAIQVQPVRALLKHFQPVKTEITVKMGKSAPELLEVVDLFAKNGVAMFLADMNHLTFGNSVNSDCLIHCVQKGSGELQDFMGCLSAGCIESLHKHVSTRNIVCLRVRVTDRNSIMAVSDTPSLLKSLLWLEIDFDLPFDQLMEIKLPRIDTPLMDLTFRDLTDFDMTRLSVFLASIRTCYSGIHLLKSEISPKGVRDLLKLFYCKGIKTMAHPDAISRYRMWRYPIIGLTGKTELADEEARHLIGHDDRPQYSDNNIKAETVIAERMEVKILATFLSALEDPVLFRYVCGNFSVIKKADGTVDIKELFGY